MLAPFSNNICAISAWPPHAARRNGVRPSCACTKLIKYTTCNPLPQNKQTLLYCIPVYFPQAAQAISSKCKGMVHASLHVHSNMSTSLQHHKCCAMCSLHQSHISAVQPFPHIALPHALILSQCPYCVHPCNKTILRAKFGLWSHHFVHNSITDAFHAIQKNLF